MTKITIFKKNGKICEFQIKGHSGYGERGQDIVCSSISTAAQMAVIGLKEVLNIPISCVTKDGYMHVTIEDFEGDSQQAILRAMEETLKSVESEFSENLKMEVKNVC